MPETAQGSRRGALLIGATSGMGRAIARRLAAEGYDLILAGRQLDELGLLAADLELRFGTKNESRPFEALDFDSHAAFFEDCATFFGDSLHGVMLCHGEMPDPEQAANDFEAARRCIDVNFSSAVSLLTAAARHLEARGRGWICAISSVAGDRGRPSNYVYGSTKAALATYLSGLRGRLARAGVSVVDVRPGFVDTALTWGRPGMFLVAAPERVADDVMRGIRRDRAVVYTPPFWALIMFVIRTIPDFLFKRLQL
ncbi:MAG: SDR family oxidoreductase [Deltaproteobacteria bacterium]|nr:SDR family oxidoreductase [Deltaproteobacteria bacterium]